MAMDEQPLRRSASVLIYAMGRCTNTGMRWEGNTLTDLGVSPILYEDIRGTLEIPSDAGKCSVWGLDGTGKRIAEIPVRKTQNGFAVTLGGYCHYEMVMRSFAPSAIVQWGVATSVFLLAGAAAGTVLHRKRKKTRKNTT